MHIMLNCMRKLCLTATSDFDSYAGEKPASRGVSMAINYRYEMHIISYFLLAC